MGPGLATPLPVLRTMVTIHQLLGLVEVSLVEVNLLEVSRGLSSRSQSSRGHAVYYLSVMAISLDNEALYLEMNRCKSMPALTAIALVTKCKGSCALLWMCKSIPLLPKLSSCKFFF